MLQWKPGTMGNAKWSPHDLHKPWLIIVNESLTGFDNMTGAQSSYSPHQSVMISNGLADIKYVLCKKCDSYSVKHRCEGAGKQVDKLLFSPSSSLSLTSFLNVCRNYRI